MCNFDITMSLTNLAEGVHEVFVYRRYLKKYNYTNDTLVFIRRVTFNIMKISGYPLTRTAAQSNCYQATEIVLLNSIPDEIKLETYPNPSQQSSIIKYAIARPQHVLIKIFDAFGRVIQTVVDEMKPTGIHEVQIDTAMFTKSGVYLFSFTTGSETKTIKLIVVK